MRYLRLLVLAAGFSLGFWPKLLSQVEFRQFTGTDIEYKVQTDMPRFAPKDAGKLGGNFVWRTRVTVRNKANEKRKIMLCLHGMSKATKNAKKFDRDSAIQLEYDAKAKVVKCKTTTKDAVALFYGNLGCQTRLLAANETAVIDFVTGSRPRIGENVSEAPVQDGQSRDANGFGPFGPGHRMKTKAGNFQVGPVVALADVLEDLMVKILIFDDQTINMACAKAPDKKVGEAEAKYAPKDCAQVARDESCNRCFGMGSLNSFPTLPKGTQITKKFNIVKSVDAAPINPPGKAKTQLPLNTETDVAQGPVPVSVALTYLEGGNTNLLQPCNSDIPGCFDATTVSTFPDVDGAYGSLNVNFPPGLPSNFAADFFVTLTRTDTGETLTENWIKVRPRIFCDVNQDGAIDAGDINAIMTVIGAEVDSGNRYKPDGSAGIVTVNDARTCATRCTRLQCAQAQ